MKGEATSSGKEIQMEVSSPFPGPGDPSKGSGEGVKILSPGDTSVFSQGSSSSDESKSATDRSPSPLNNLHESTLSSQSSKCHYMLYLACGGCLAGVKFQYLSFLTDIA